MYIPLPVSNPYFLRATLFHLASDCTISTFLFIFGTLKFTAFSTPFKLSFVPVSGNTNKGDETLVNFSSSESLCSK